MALMIALVAVATGALGQVPRLDEAEASAKKENKLILLKFSGSDWCGPCIQLQKVIIDDPAFVAFANQKLVLLLADFPRQKKHRLSAELQQQNDKLAEQYNPKGEFPYMALLDANGKTLHTWSGYDKKLSVADYVSTINGYIK